MRPLEVIGQVKKVKKNGKYQKGASSLFGDPKGESTKNNTKGGKITTMKKLKKLSLNMCIYMYLDYSKTNERGDAV